MTVGQNLRTNSWDAAYENTVSGSSLVSLTETCADSGTTDITVAIDVSAVKGIIMSSNKAVTVTTNSGPDNTIALAAGVPYVWTTNNLDTLALTVDVTAIHVTNASGSAATFDLQVLSDATP